jgi:alpha-glucosidase
VDPLFGSMEDFERLIQAVTRSWTEDFWPTFKGRDGCRTPMPWRETASAGFAEVTPWLPIPHEHRQVSVQKQDRDSTSVLNAFRSFLKWRKELPSLHTGDIRFLDMHAAVLSFTRSHGNEKLFIAFNLSSRPIVSALPDSDVYVAIEAPGLMLARLQGRTVHLPAYGALFAKAS